MKRAQAERPNQEKDETGQNNAAQNQLKLCLESEGSYNQKK